MATGTMVSVALKASESLQNNGLNVCVVDMFRLKPIDETLIRSAVISKLIVSIEEHNKMGGLGAAIAEVMSDSNTNASLLRLGVNDCFDTACDYEGLLTKNRLTPELIAEDILERYRKL